MTDTQAAAIAAAIIYNQPDVDKSHAYITEEVLKLIRLLDEQYPKEAK